MPPAAPIILAVLCLTASSVSGQRGGNYVDEYGDYDSPAPPPRVASRPLPRPSVSSSVAAAPRPTPVPILKQINRHNEDGSYTYGYEGADGSFKIETKLPNGEVMGKYGYVDDLGKVRVVEYGANKYGFQPAGEGITIPPPTLVDETKTRKGPQGQTVQYVDDGQYYPEEEPEIAQAPLRPAPRPAPAPRPKALPRPQLSLDEYELEPVRPQSHAAPAPPRPVFANAVPAQPAPQRSVPRPQIFDSPRPRPVYQSAPAPRAQPVFSNAAPLSRPQIFQDSPAPRAQVFRPAPVYEEAPAPRPAPQRIPVPRSNSGGGGILDQLARDYALPQGGASVADISFGSY